MCEELLRERIKNVFEREIDRVEQISHDNPLKDNVRLIFVVEEYKEILREILEEDAERVQS